MTGLPLSGCVVVEAAQRIAGPLAGLHMALLGAEVVKAEPAGGDAARHWRQGEAFAVLNAGKRIVSLEERTLAELVRDADAAIVDGDSDVDAVKAELEREGTRLRSAVVIDQGPPPGASGTSETVVQAALAFTRYVGDPDGEPARIGADLASATCGVQAAQALLAGLLPGREGSLATVSARRALATMKTIHFAARTDAARWEGYHLTAGERPPDQGYRAADGRLSFEFPPNTYEGWKEFCSTLGLDDLVEEVGDDWYGTTGMGDLSDWARPRFEAALASRTRDEVVDLARRLGGWAVPFLSPAEVVSHPQTALFGAVHLDDAGVHLTPPWKMAVLQGHELSPAQAPVGGDAQ